MVQVLVQMYMHSRSDSVSPVVVYDLDRLESI